ncbi:hypothetical protein JCM10450v2_001076 [Rhodotorula kratochvilovae]
MSSIDIKLSHGGTGETRLVSLPVQPAPSWAELAEQIQQRFALEVPPPKVTYLDDEGDEITLSTDEELAELWCANATETTLAFVFNPVERTIEDNGKHARDAEQAALLESIRKALEKDASLAHDIREVVHDVLGAPRHFRHFHHPRHPHTHFDGHRGRGRGGRGGLGKGGRHHGRWDLRSPARELEEDSSDSSDSDSVTEKQDEEKEPRGRRHGGRSGRKGKGFKHGRFAPEHPFAGPPPPHHHHHHHHRAGPPPPPPGPPPFHFGFIALPPPHLIHHGHGGRRHGKNHGPPPPFPPPFGPHHAPEVDPNELTNEEWLNFADYPQQHFRGGRHGRHGGHHRF